MKSTKGQMGNMHKFYNCKKLILVTTDTATRWKYTVVMKYVMWGMKMISMKSTNRLDG